MGELFFLREAEIRTRPRVNADIEEALEAGALDAGQAYERNYNPVPPPPAIGMLIADALELGDDEGLRMPFEVIK